MSTIHAMKKNFFLVVNIIFGGGEVLANTEKDEIVIKVPDKGDYDNIWELIETINDEQDRMRTFEDFNVKHSKETLKNLIESENEMEQIWIAILKGKIIGMININYQKPDYLFFDDKYVYIKYLYVQEGMEVCSKLLVDAVIEEAKQYGFEYICSDLKMEDSRTEQLLKENLFEDYRFRLAKELYEE